MKEFLNLSLATITRYYRVKRRVVFRQHPDTV